MAADDTKGSQDSKDKVESLGGLGDAIKKVLTVGLGAAFMTEEGIRNYLGEIKLPKEILQTLLNSAAKSKEELMGRVGQEAVRMISQIDFVKEASRFVEEHKFRITAEIEVQKKDSSQKPT